MLQVISGDTLSVASMVEAAYFIGRGRKVVLYLNDVPHGDSLEASGIKVSISTHTHACTHARTYTRTYTHRHTHTDTHTHSHTHTHALYSFFLCGNTHS